MTTIPETILPSLVCVWVCTNCSKTVESKDHPPTCVCGQDSWSVDLLPPPPPAVPAYVHVSTVAPDPHSLPGVRLDLYANPDFPRKWGAVVKSMGGRYSECRGNTQTRFVNFPLGGSDLPDDVTPEEIVLLINDICADATPVTLGTPKTKKFTFVFSLPPDCKTGDARSWICVNNGINFQQAARAFVASYEDAVERKLAPTVAEMWKAGEAKRIEQTARELNLDAMRSIPGVVAEPHYIGRFTLPLANGLTLGLSVDARGIIVEGLAPFNGRRFTTEQVIALATAIGAVTL